MTATAMPTDSAVPWAPQDLPVAATDLGSWSYVVLEEIVDDAAVLHRWSWPLVDPLGRLLWPERAAEASSDAAVDLDLLRAQLYTPNKIMRRPRCGDTFAAPPGDLSWDGQQVVDLRELLGSGGIYDISADAREAAKIAYQSSLAAIQPASAADDESQAAVERVLRRRSEQPLHPLRLSPPPDRARPARIQ
jgi:hypothetical protein